MLYAGHDTIEFSLAGLHYRSHAAKEAATDICNGTDLSLKLNPSNEYDSSAVKVFYENYHIGFAPSSDSEEVTNFIKTHKNITAIAIDVDEVYNDNFNDYETLIGIKVYGEKVEHKQKKEANLLQVVVRLYTLKNMPLKWLIKKYQKNITILI